MENVAAVSSVLSITTISVDRYLAICRHSSHNPLSSPRNVLVIITVLWILSCLFCTPFFAMTNFEKKNSTDGSLISICQVLAQENMYTKGYIMGYTATFYVLPSINLLILYQMIARHISKELLPGCNSIDGLVNNSRKASLARRSQAIQMLKVITVVFFVCLLPLHVLRLYFLFATRELLGKMGREGIITFLYSSRVMFYLNSCINPIIYNLMSKKFRMSFIQTLSLSRSDSFINGDKSTNLISLKTTSIYRLKQFA